MLEKKNIHIYAHIAQIGDVKDRPFQQLGGTDYTALEDKSFCVIDDAQGEKMMERIEQARQSQDSVGGCVEGLIDSLPAGLGNPVFESVESGLAGLLLDVYKRQKQKCRKNKKYKGPFKILHFFTPHN